jgi:hypothetical protein
VLNPQFRNEIIELLNKLGAEQQRNVLLFTRSLVSVATGAIGVPGTKLLSLSGAIPAEDLQSIAQYIEQDCEQVSIHEW